MFLKTFNELKVAIIQADLVWENPTENRNRFEKKITNLAKQPVDLIVLPEMFTTGFTMNAEKLAEKMDGETVLWMQKMAKKTNAAIIGSIIVSENKNYYNRLLFIHPSGKINTYDKRHTFTLAGENKVFSEGKEKITIEYRGWRICPFICYDLRFPVWSRNTENYDILLYVASWPKPRINAWKSLLKARAIENMCYTIGVNRVGKDVHNYEYTGNSIFIDCMGNSLSNSLEKEILITGKEVVILKTLKKDFQENWRKRLSFLEDKDNFSIQ